MQHGASRGWKSVEPRRGRKKYAPVWEDLMNPLAMEFAHLPPAMGTVCTRSSLSRPGPHSRLLLQPTKDSTIYVIDRDQVMARWPTGTATPSSLPATTCSAA